MAGQKGKSGGKRQGAGRKANPHKWRQLRLNMSDSEWQFLLERLPKNGRDKAIVLLESFKVN